jgi:hypothetical protein
MMNMNRKQQLLVIGGVVVVLLLFVLFLAFQQSSQTPSTKITAGVTPGEAAGGQANGGGNAGNQNGSTAPEAAGPTATPLPQQLSAADTTRAFYNSFATGNPLANGAFDTNQYLTANFKNIISKSYKKGNTPVFCPVDRRPQITVGKESQEYYDNGYLTEETISDASGSGQDLYLVQLRNNNNQWQIFDITCL